MISDNDNDPIVITAGIINFDVKMILIDNGSVMEVFSLDAFRAMRLKEKDFEPAKPIYGFANQPIKVLGQVTLPKTLGQGEYKLTVLTCFLVVNQPSTYNTIFGPIDEAGSDGNNNILPNNEFLTPMRIGYMRADKTVASNCHLNFLRIIEGHKWAHDVMEISRYPSRATRL